MTNTPSLLEIDRKRKKWASTLASTLNLCKVGFNYLLIHTGFPHTFYSNFNREEKKKNTKATVLVAVSFTVINYQSYGFDEKCLVEKNSCKKTEYQYLPFDIQEKEIVITVS